MGLYVSGVTGRKRIPGPVVGAGRGVVRGYGLATARLRQGPDFLLIGAKRGGSTSLYYTLLQHSRILPLFPSARLVGKTDHTKGVHYFDSNYPRGAAWYRSHFPTDAARRRSEQAAGGPVVVGEGSPYYLFHPLAAERAGNDVPQARILLILRDPIERAFSHYRERLREGAEDLSFAEALAAEPDRLKGEEDRIRNEPGYVSYAHEQQSYRAQSEYAPALARWLERFPREQVHVLAAEHFYAEPQRACDSVFAFLGLPAAPLRDMRPWNAAPSRKLEPKVRQELAEHFAPYNAELERMLGQSFPWTTGAT
jgi:hypothetical protein